MRLMRENNKCRQSNSSSTLQRTCKGIIGITVNTYIRHVFISQCSHIYDKSLQQLYLNSNSSLICFAYCSRALCSSIFKTLLGTKTVKMYCSLFAFSKLMWGVVFSW